MEMYLYYVETPIGQFIGVADSLASAVEHFGTRAKITKLETPEQVTKALCNLRLKGQERVFLAW